VADDGTDVTAVKWERVFLAGTLLVVSIFLLLNLGNHYLWQDEAQTALLGKSVLKSGLPFGTDGKNFFSQELGAEYGAGYIWKWHTWLPFYLVAFSFKIFGVGTFAARLPFALFGIGLVLLTYCYSMELWSNKRVAVYGVILLSFCVPFLLLSRQCRYYSPAAFFSLLGLWQYSRLIRRGHLSICLFIVSVFLLFHTHYLYAGTLIAATAVHCALSHRKDLARWGIACGGAILTCLPWVVWLAGMRYGERYGAQLFNPANIFIQCSTFARQIFRDVIPSQFIPVLLVVWIVGRFLKRHPSISKEVRACSWSAVAILGLFTLITLFALSATSPAPFFRYLTPVIPPLLMLLALLVDTCSRQNVLLGGGVLAVFLSLQPVRNFAYELTHNYKGPIKGIATFLNANARPDDVVAITYGDMPLKFYTNLRIVGGLTGEDLTPALKARWVIIRHNVICEKDYAVLQYLMQNIDFSRYRAIELDYPDIPYENRESPDEHHYRTVESAPRVTVFERIMP
jgi:4-amino-4-deoxy-L-arabinose transferase-like glycosyltransferase